MWTGEANLDDLHKRPSWKVEFFCGESLPHVATAFPLCVIGDIVRERKESIDPQAQPDNLINYLGLENVQSTTGNLVDFAARYGKEIKSRSKIFRPGDILYGRLRPYLNKVYVADGLVESGICSTEFLVLIPDIKRVLPHFLRGLLSSAFVHQVVSRLQTGSALPRLQLDDLLSIEVPLPPIGQQQAYETFLKAQAAYQQKLAEELANLPQKTLSAFMRSLKTGEPPEVMH
ncbi:MAG: restriction endonuclease subunit S [Pyrinomonadaceae bacterium]